MTRRPKRTAFDEYGITIRDRFLDSATCVRLIREAKRGPWLRSTVVTSGPASLWGVGRERDSLTLSRDGYSSAIVEQLRALEQRLVADIGLRPHHLEPWQFTRYTRGQRFDFHLDCGACRSDPGGERERTLLLYLECPISGGATVFRALRRTIEPVVGRLVVWNNLLANGRCNHGMIHAGMPVECGAKTVLTTWEHQRPLRDKSGGRT